MWTNAHVSYSEKCYKCTVYKRLAWYCLASPVKGKMNNGTSTPGNSKTIFITRYRIIFDIHIFTQIQWTHFKAISITIWIPNLKMCLITIKHHYKLQIITPWNMLMLNKHIFLRAEASHNILKPVFAPENTFLKGGMFLCRDFWQMYTDLWIYSQNNLKNNNTATFLLIIDLFASH